MQTSMQVLINAIANANAMRKNGTPYRELNTYIGRKYKYANNKAKLHFFSMRFKLFT